MVEGLRLSLLQLQDDIQLSNHSRPPSRPLNSYERATDDGIFSIDVAVSELPLLSSPQVPKSPGICVYRRQHNLLLCDYVPSSLVKAAAGDGRCHRLLRLAIEVDGQRHIAAATCDNDTPRWRGQPRWPRGR